MKCQFVFFVAYISACFAFSSKCQRHPYGATVPQTPGDGGFRIKISGNPEKYVPGEVYTVSLQGQRSQYNVQKFTGFMLIVEAATSADVYGPQSVGTFQLYGDVLTMHSEGCPNAVIQTSNIVKSEVQVLWTAPPSGSGCLRFKAVVIEQRDLWFMDDNELTRELCEEVQESDDMQPEVIYDCCACDEAKYEVTFEGLWSRQTHPKDFPANEWLTHFSDIIGASHSNDYRVWEYGGLASDGLRQVAEWGSTRTLESELKRQSDHIRTIIKARGLWYPNVNGKTFAVFRVDNRHHLMSLVSMLGPTPDWVVGVSALELCLKNCSWVGQKTLNLYPWDAGTDSGVTYMSANAPTIPRQKIRRITNSYPNDPKNPFYDPKGLPMKPLARLTISRQRVYEKSCSDTGIIDNDDFPLYDNSQFEDSERPECAVSQWTEYSACSVTCGKGLRMRSRHYLIPMKADMAQCKMQLVEKEMCAASVPYCEGGSSNNFFGGKQYNFELNSVCKTTDWSSWSPCSVTCGEGFKMRSRRYMDRMGRKKCNEKLIEKQSCYGSIAECDQQEENIDPACAVTQWTNWSPCSVTCGEGVRVRTRYFLVPTSNQATCGVNSMDKMICQGERKDCTINESEAKEVCIQEMYIGPCRGYFPRWYYNSLRGMCVQFIYGGCRGNRNNFKSYDECTKMCEFARDELTNGIVPGSSYNISSFLKPGPNNDENSPFYNPSESITYPRNLVSESQLGTKVDCKMTKWSEWSDCTVTCGTGWIESKRIVKVQPQFGGKACPKKVVRRKKCKNPRCGTSNNHNLESMSSIFEHDYLPPPVSSREFHNNRLSFPNQLSTADDSQESLMKEMQANDSKLDCVMGDWGPWSPCTRSCGPEALQQRARSIVVKPKLGGVPCGPSLERRFCTLPPCSRKRGYS